MKKHAPEKNHDAVNACAEDVFQLAVERYRDEESGALSADTLLATTAALTGEMTRRVVTDMNNPKDVAEANSFLKIIADCLKHVVLAHGGDMDKLPSFDGILAHTLENPNKQDGPVFTVDPYHTPHEPPALGAAALREDVFFIAQSYGLTDEERAAACLIALAKTMDVTAPVIDMATAYQLAMETAVGVAHMEPLDRSLAPTRNKLYISKRLLSAAAEVTRIVIKQNMALENGAPHPQTLTAKTGALLGEMAHRAGIDDRTSTADYFISEEVDTYLEDCNVMFMASYIRRGGQAEELAEYGEYVANAAACYGQNPYPKHTVGAADLPHSFPAAEAAMAREPVMEVAEKFHLSAWERATACAIALNDTIRFAETVIPTQIAFRLAMEEAAAIARLKPLDLDALMESAPEPVRQGIASLRKKAALALDINHGPHLPF